MLYQELHASRPTPAGRLTELGVGLRDLSDRLKDEVARLVAEAVARAVRDALRRLLGTQTEEVGDASCRPNGLRH